MKSQIEYDFIVDHKLQNVQNQKSIENKKKEAFLIF